MMPRLPAASRINAGPQLSNLLDGLLEPLAEDRLTAQEASDIATGRVRSRQAGSSSSSSSRSRQQVQQPAQPASVRLRDGTAYR